MNRVKKKPLFCSIFFLIFCSLLLSTTVTAGTLEQVPWSRLAYYLESQQVELLDLPTCDCPLAINQ
ncbi:MAG: hypothetical protein GXO34_06580, partial [Deltaproteobacteria bacterium]|nr:hypothetical protein [Deltaproteobacteria bacterium]